MIATTFTYSDALKVKSCVVKLAEYANTVCSRNALETGIQKATAILRKKYADLSITLRVHYNEPLLLIQCGETYRCALEATEARRIMDVVETAPMPQFKFSSKDTYRHDLYRCVL